MPVLSFVGTVGILLAIPAFSVLYREFLDTGRVSLRLTAIISAASAAIWVLARVLTPGAWQTSLEAPVAALAAVAGFLVSIAVRNATSRPLPAVLYSLGWVALVFVPVATTVFFPGDVGLGLSVGPVDLGGGLVIGVAVGGAALVVQLLSRDRTGARSRVRPRPGLLAVSGLVLWAGWLVGLLALDGSFDSVIAPRIAVAAIVAPLLGIVGWLIAQRLQTATTTLFGVTAGLASGLVAISAGAASFTPLWAGITGLAAGIGGSLLTTRLARGTPVRPWLLVGVHLLAAAIGLVTVGLFALGNGFIYDGQTTGIEVQFLSALLVAVWATIVSVVLWLVLRRTARNPAS